MKNRRTLLAILLAIAIAVVLILATVSRNSDHRIEPSVPTPEDSTLLELPDDQPRADSAPTVSVEIPGHVESAFSGLPLPGAVLTAVAGFARWEADAGGGFLLELAATGSPHVVRVGCRGYFDREVSIAVPEQGKPLAPLVVRLQPEVMLNVLVEDEDGRPVEGAGVFGWRIRLGDAVLSDRYASNRLFQAVTDREGRAAVPWPSGKGGEPVIDFVLEAVGARGNFAFLPIDEFSSQEHLIRLPSFSSTVIVQADNWAARVPAVANIVVSWNPGDLTLPFREIGRAELTRASGDDLRYEVPPGLVRVTGTIDSPEWRVRCPDTTTEAGKLHRAKVVAYPILPHGPKGGSAEVTVSVSDEEGNPIAGVAVVMTFFKADEDPVIDSISDWTHHLTDEHGTAVARKRAFIDAHMYVFADHPEFERSRQLVGVVTAHDEQKEMSIVLMRKVRDDVVRIRLLGKDGAPLVTTKAWWATEKLTLDRAAAEVRLSSRPDGTHVIGPIDDLLLEELAMGRLESLVFDVPGHRLTPVTLEWLKGQAKAGGVADIVLPETGRVAVTVTRGGAPVPFARVVTPAVDTRARVNLLEERVTDQDGRVSLVMRHPAGKHAWVIARTAALGAHAVKCGPGDDSVAISMDTATSQTGIVMRAGGPPAAGAEIYSYPEILGSPLLNDFVSYTTANPDGTFELENLISGIPIRISATYRAQPGAKAQRIHTYAVAGSPELRMTLPD